MKTEKYYFIIGIIIGILCVPVLGTVEPPWYEDKPLLIGQANPALAGIEKLYVELRPDTRISHVGITTLQDIHEKVEHKLVEANIKIISRPFTDLRPKPFLVPELRIDIGTLKLDDSQKYVFRVQTSLARMVNLPKHRFHIKADVWKTEPVMQAVLIKDMPAKVTGVVLEQVETFIHAYLAANPPGKQPSDAKAADTVSLITPNDPSKQSAKQVVAQYKYVASKNSKVFHKPQCSSAKRILPKNLVGYHSRDEATKAGKRPCKLCKP